MNEQINNTQTISRAFTANFNSRLNLWNDKDRRFCTRREADQQTSTYQNGLFKINLNKTTEI